VIQQQAGAAISAAPILAVARAWGLGDSLRGLNAIGTRSSRRRERQSPPLSASSADTATGDGMAETEGFEPSIELYNPITV
jgi:hypothetical protein